MKKRYALLALPLAGGVWFALARGDSSARAAAPVAPTVLVAPGHVEPVRDPVKLAFESQGRIAEILVDEGDAVTAGQLLARLDDRMPRAQLAAAEAQLASANARLLLARRGPRREELAAARADADAAAAEAAHRGRDAGRSDSLGKQGAIAPVLVDADATAASVATAQSAAARARYQNLALGTRPETIAEASAAVSLAQAQLAQAQVALDQTVIKAPAAGVILRRTAEVGAIVTWTAPLPVLEMANIHDLEIRAEIDEADVAALAVGTPAYATADAFGDKQFPVHVKRLTQELGRKTVRDDDPRARVDTRVLEVIATFDTPSPLPLGLRMSVHVAR
ncbi:MAG TPA: HlyD family efflux transporter periplasmic adaptor subunit [Kofleriaceae bacterium]|jgi:multidrug resistance efflux pump